MGLFSSIFNPGSSEAKRIRKASAKAQGVLDSALPEARSLLTGGYDTAEGLIDTGYGEAMDYLNNAFDPAFAQLGAGYDRARDELEGRYADADAYITGGRDLARELMDPWIASGRGAQDLYDRALGLQGTDAQEDFYTDYADHDPFRAFRDEMALKQFNAYSNASGGGTVDPETGEPTSGRAGLQYARASLERGTEDLNRYLDRLEGQGTRGAGYAQNAAGLEERTGLNRANLSSRLGEVLAANETDRGVRESGMTYGHGQNQGNLALGRTQAQSNLALSRGSDEANLVYGHAQQNANNIMGTANAVNQAKATGKQNLIGGLSTLASAFIPGASGVSLAGNIGNRLLGGWNSTTQSGTAANGGWTTTTTPSSWWG